MCSKISCFLAFFLTIVLANAASAAAPPPSNFEFYERYIAIDDACAWPRLTILPNGELAAFIWPNNSHGLTEGAIECWTSGDHGMKWAKRSTPLAAAAGSNLMHVAAGVVGESLMVIEGGLSPRRPYTENARLLDRSDWPKTTTVEVVAAKSGDAGKTWSKLPPLNFDKRSVSGKNVTPYGNIAKLPDGSYGVCLYGDGVSFYVTRDGGVTWSLQGMVAGSSPDLASGSTHNETVWMALENGDLFAAARSYRTSRNLGAGGLDAFRSIDNGVTWKYEGPLSLPDQFPADLMRMPDGRLLLTYSSRNPGSWAIWIRYGSADGKAWSEPTLLVDLEDSTETQYAKLEPTSGARIDGGYPSTVLAADGTYVTAYYSRGVPAHQRYHMGVVRWRPKGGGL